MTASSQPDRVLLISDLHLSPARPDLVQALYAFLRKQAAACRALYILGDLFDAWVGDDDDTPLYADIAAALQRFVASGPALYLMHGNRDFLLGTCYAKACGATLLPEPHVLEHLGRRYLLLHGDVLCTQDNEYQALRTMVRNPAWQQQVLQRPLAERRALAAQLREKSRTMSSNKPEDIMDVTPGESRRLLEQHQVGVLIHGHTHRPAVHWLLCGELPCRRIVLGDWDHDGWYVEIAATGPQLTRFALAPH